MGYSSPTRTREGAMKLTELWQEGRRPTLSLEVYPAHTAKAQGKLDQVIDALAQLEPTFCSVTFGAGGSTREGSRQLIEKLRRDKRLDVLAYLAGYGLGPQQVDEVLDDYVALGVENILLVRGDPPEAGGDAAAPPQEPAFPHATDLLERVRQRLGLCLGVAGYPEGHKEATSKEDDLRFLKLKVIGGAQFVITQYFYDTRFFLDFRERARAAGITVPIIPGVMPIFSVKMMESLASLCGASIPDAVRTGLAALPEGDKDALLQFGIELAVRQCQELLAVGVPGLHFYTMDRSESVLPIVQRLRRSGAL
jgi:methylenetetrahydrofolate reductase (NADPH)